MAWSQSGNIRGASGVPGASGPPGATGPQGPSGPTGATGASGGTGGTGGPGTTSWNDITDKPGAILNYKGTWNASTNTSPALSDGTGSGGDVYRVSVGGSRNLGSGTISWEVGDYAIYSPVTSSWEKADTTDAVSSVAGRTGAVTLTSADLGASGSASSSTFLRGDNTWAVPSDTGITRSISTVTSNTTVGSTANTDYVVFANIAATNADASFSSVVALLLGNGTNNSTVLTDSSPLAANWTAAGNTKITTATKKFGSGSISTDGTSGTYARASAATSNFAFSGDLTVEFWVYFNSVPADQPIFDFRDASNTGNFSIVTTSTSRLGVINPTINGTTLMTTGTWYHVAVCRSGTSMRLFVNGTQEGSTATTSTSYGGVLPTLGARYSNDFNVNALWDDIRITKTARYTSNFTAPTAELPVNVFGTITVPTAVSSTNEIRIKNIHSTDPITIATTSSQTIDGSSALSLTAGSTARLISDNANWRTT